MPCMQSNAAEPYAAHYPTAVATGEPTCDEPDIDPQLENTGVLSDTSSIHPQLQTNSDMSANRSVQEEPQVPQKGQPLQATHSYCCTQWASVDNAEADKRQI